jgi:transposase
MRLIEGLLDVNQRRQNWGRRFEARQIAIRLDAELPGQSTREVANLAGVRASTVSRWRKDPEYQQAVEHERRRRQQV